MDVFISYSHKDAQWVRGDLKPTIESWELEVGIDHEDFLPGQRIASTIRENLTVARHVLFVCSQSFISSEWCREELETVRAQDPGSLKAKAIPIVLDRKAVPDLLMDTVWCDLSMDRNDNHEWEKLRRAVVFARTTKIEKLKSVFADERDMLKRIYVLKMIAELAGGEEITWLKKVAEGDFEHGCREFALAEIIRIDRNNQIDWLRNLVINETWSSVRVKALEAIVTFSFHDCRNWLVDIVNGDDDYDLRSKALKLLIDGEADTRSLLTWFQDLLKEEKHYVLGNYIIDMLVEIGGKDQLPYLRQLAEETQDAHICIHACDHVLQNDSGDHIAILCLKKVLQNKIGYSSKGEALRKLQSLDLDPYEEWIATLIEGKEMEIR